MPHFIDPHVEPIGPRLLRVGSDLRLDRLATLGRIEAQPVGSPGRDLALTSLRLAAWVDSALLWAGWRLTPQDSLLGG